MYQRHSSLTRPVSERSLGKGIRLKRTEFSTNPVSVIKGDQGVNSEMVLEDIHPAMSERSAAIRLIVAVLCCVFAAVPFLVTQFPPITDLPQQSAQIRLLLEALHNPDTTPYKIQWFTPYSLSYLVLGGSWGLFGPANAGRMAMLAIVLLWIVAIHLIAYARDRSAASAVLAGAFALNHIAYWGFYSFAIGWPSFLLWFHVTGTSYSREFSAKDALLLLGAGLLLYISHVLWLAAGLIWLVLSGLVLRGDVKGTLLRTAYLIPLLVLVGVWYPQFSASSMSTPALWVSSPLSRLSLSWLSDAALGGIRGLAVPVLFCATVAWIGLAAVQNRHDLKRLVDWEMFLAACMFLVLGLALPDKFMNTIRFGERWMPAAFILMVLAVPAPVIRPAFRRAVALITVASFCLMTSLAWMSFEREDLSGLDDALHALPASPRVLGLDFIRKSEFVRGYPFIQVFAYSQVFKGGMLNFSFAEFSPCLVVYKKPFVRPWTGGLEWYPRRVRSTDLDYFDHALIAATQSQHQFWTKNPRLTPVTLDGRWRLYRISPPPAPVDLR